jgi:hypothetical protein
MKKKKIITGTYILTAFEDGTVFLATTGQRDFNYQFDNAKITGIMQANVNPMLRKVSLYYLLSTAFHKNEYFFPALTIKSQIFSKETCNFAPLPKTGVCNQVSFRG